MSARPEPPSYKAGVLLLSLICGLIDATCLLALGGVFAELMTGNVLLLALGLGSRLITVTWAVSLIGAIIPFVIGAFAAGLATNGRHTTAARLIGYPVECAAVVAATILALVTTPEVSGLMAEESFFMTHDGSLTPVPHVDALVIVALLAFAMGIHNAMMRKHGVPDVATNLLTLTMAALVSDSALAGGQSFHWRRRLLSIVLFIVGAASGAFLLRFHVALPLIAASVIFVLALWPLVKGRPEPTAAP